MATEIPARSGRAVGAQREPADRREAQPRALRAPLLAAPAVLAHSEMVAVVSASTARAFARAAPLQVLRLPFASPRLVTAMLWHRRHDDMPAQRWLRRVVLRVARKL